MCLSTMDLKQFKDRCKTVRSLHPALILGQEATIHVKVTSGTHL